MADRPGVGQHLQDHLEVYIQFKSLQPVSMQPSATQLWRRPFIGAQWLFLRSGPGATNHFEGGGFVRSNDDVAYPNLMFHFLPLAIRYDGSAGTPGHGYQVHVGPMYSDARGSITLKSTDPRDHPALRFNYLSTDQDRREWVEAVRVARHLLNQPAMAPYNGGETSPGPGVETDDEILEWVRRDAETALHPSCTARMGIDDLSVTDPLTMRVHGAGGPARRRRLGDALRHQRQHLRAGDDAGREGRGPHRREHAAPARAASVLPPRGVIAAGLRAAGCEEGPMPEYPSFALTGQVALVTGAARGLGRAIALALADAGADVALGLREAGTAVDLVAEIEAMGRRAVGVQMDVTRSRATRPGHRHASSSGSGAWTSSSTTPVSGPGTRPRTCNEADFDLHDGRERARGSSSRAKRPPA